MANLRGRQVVQTLTNKSGGAVIAGDVVVIDTANDEAFTTTTTGQAEVSVGIAQEAIASNAAGRVLVAGYAALVNVPSSMTRGRYIETHTVVKQATGSATRRAGSFGQFFKGGTTPSGWLWGATDQTAGGGSAQFDVDGTALRLKTGTDRIAQIDSGNANEAEILLVSNTISIRAYDGTDGSTIDMSGNAAPSLVLGVSNASGAEFSSVDIEPMTIELFTTAGKVRVWGNGLVFPSLASDPASPTAGQVYFNTVSNKLRGWDGSAWNNLW